MAFVDKHLVPGEVVVYRARPHWWPVVTPLVLPGLIIFGLYSIPTAWLKDPESRAALEGAIDIAAALCVVIAGIRCLRVILIQFGQELALTNRRVVLRQGVLRRSCFEARLPVLAGVNVEQTGWGRLLNYGTITVQAGAASATLDSVASPYRFRRRVHETTAAAEIIVDQPARVITASEADRPALAAPATAPGPSAAARLAATGGTLRTVGLAAWDTLVAWYRWASDGVRTLWERSGGEQPPVQRARVASLRQDPAPASQAARAHFGGARQPEPANSAAEAQR